MKPEDIIKSREAVEVLKRVECPSEWRETFYRNLNFMERVIDSIEDRKKLIKESNG